jgi:hypothetical protein
LGRQLQIILEEAESDVLTGKHDITDPRYFQAQSTTCVNFPWVPAPEEIPASVMSAKTVDSTLPANGLGVPDIYAEEGDKEEDPDRLFLDSEEGH